MAHGVHLVLTGHFHVNGITTYRTPGAEKVDSLVEITTGSPITYPCPYRWLMLSENRADVQVETAFIESLPELNNMHQYSREWMSEHATNMIPQLSLRAWRSYICCIAMAMNRSTRREIRWRKPSMPAWKV